MRKELETQNEKAKADGSPAIDGSQLIALSEGLLPKLRQAEWRDRADAALTDMAELDLKDLRSVVVAADDAAKDDEARAIAIQLREGLSARVEAAQTEWVAEITTTLTDGRVVRALRLSSRPPKAGALLPGDLLQRLTDAANEAVKGDVAQQRLATILDAVSRSVVRPNFVLETVPAEPSEELLDMVKKTASQLPETAAKFGVTSTRRPRGGGKKSAPKRPPKPTKPPKPAADSDSSDSSVAVDEAKPTEEENSAPGDTDVPVDADAAAEPATDNAASTDADNAPPAEPAADEASSDSSSTVEPVPEVAETETEEAPEAPEAVEESSEAPEAVEGPQAADEKPSEG